MSTRPALREISHPEAEQPQHGEVNRHAHHHQSSQSPDARPTAAGQPALFAAHAEPQRQPQHQQCRAQLGEELAPAGFRLVDAALRAAQASAPQDVLIEVEVRNFAELSEALQAGARRILLDNFTLPDLKIAVRETRKRATLEVSGGVTLENIHAVAQTGVDFISVGDLTKNLRAVDLSLRFL